MPVFFVFVGSVGGLLFFAFPKKCLQIVTLKDLKVWKSARHPYKKGGSFWMMINLYEKKIMLRKATTIKLVAKDFQVFCLISK